MPLIPRNYEEWKHCITVECEIPLTAEFVAQRIDALQNMDDFRTARFVERWGAAHHARTLAWFRDAEQELNE